MFIISPNNNSQSLNFYPTTLRAPICSSLTSILPAKITYHIKMPKMAFKTLITVAKSPMVAQICFRNNSPKFHYLINNWWSHSRYLYSLYIWFTSKQTQSRQLTSKCPSRTWTLQQNRQLQQKLSLSNENPGPGNNPQKTPQPRVSTSLNFKLHFYDVFFQTPTHFNFASA